MVATAAAIATEARRGTEQAIADAQTQTALPLVILGTQAAMTATAQPVSITQTAISDGARIARAQTQSAFVEYSMTESARPTVAAALATRQAEVDAWQSTGDNVAAFGWGLLQFVVALFIAVVLVALAMALAAWVAYLWRPRLQGDTILVPGMRGWKVIQSPALPAPRAPVGEQPSAQTNEDKAWRAWYVSMLGAAERRGGLGYQKLADLFSNDRDAWFENFAGPLVRMRVVAPIRQGRATQLEPGWTITAVCKMIEMGTTPPHPAGPPPVAMAAAPQSTVPTAETA